MFKQLAALVLSSLVFSGCLSPKVTSKATPPLEQDTFRVVTYNISNNPDNESEVKDITTIFNGIAELKLQDVSTRPHIIALQETDSASSLSVTDNLSVMFDEHGASYQQVVSASVGGDRSALIYDESSFVFISSEELTDSALTRPVLKVKLKPIGSNEFIYFYVIHLKSGSTNDIKSIRQAEAHIILDDANNTNDGGKVFLGDLNICCASEPAWSELLKVAFDPIDSSGEWRDNPNYKDIHTQNPKESMDDRFDFQLISQELMDGGGIDWVEGSYSALGNNGTHNINGSIETGNGGSRSLIGALMRASDHLPVIADYRY